MRREIKFRGQCRYLKITAIDLIPETFLVSNPSPTVERKSVTVNIHQNRVTVVGRRPYFEGNALMLSPAAFLESTQPRLTFSIQPIARSWNSFAGTKTMIQSKQTLPKTVSFGLPNTLQKKQHTNLEEPKNGKSQL
jgi:hypothetical protein